jgi:hypothetical protein
LASDDPHRILAEAGMWYLSYSLLDSSSVKVLVKA